MQVRHGQCQAESDHRLLYIQSTPPCEMHTGSICDAGSLHSRVAQLVRDGGNCMDAVTWRPPILLPRTYASRPAGLLQPSRVHGIIHYPAYKGLLLHGSGKKRETKAFQKTQQGVFPQRSMMCSEREAPNNTLLHRACPAAHKLLQNAPYSCRSFCCWQTPFPHASSSNRATVSLSNNTPCTS